MSGARKKSIPPGPAPREIEREAARIFPRLTGKGAHLAVAKASCGSRPDYHVVTGAGGSTSARIAPVPHACVEAFQRQGWMSGGDGALRLTDAGRAWLRRRLADQDSFRRQHQERAETARTIAGTQRPVVVNEAESPLAWLRRRKDKSGAPLITEFQFAAGEHLRSDFWRAQMTPHVTSNWGSAAPSRRMRRGPPDHSGAMRDDVLAAKQRVLRALVAVGPELAGILVDVCCHLQGLADAEQSHGWPQRSGKVILQIALTRLARHYGLVSNAEVAAPIRQRLRHWGTEDYKPDLQAWR